MGRFAALAEQVMRERGIGQGPAAAMTEPKPAPARPSGKDRFADLVADCERRFGPGSGYLAMLGRLVSTPRGTGRVVQAFADRVAVDLGETAPDWRGDPRRVVSYFAPREVEAIQ